MTDDVFVASGNNSDVECRFDESTGILHVIVDGPICEDQSSESDLLKLIGRLRRNRPLNGIVIFNRHGIEPGDVTEVLHYHH